MFFRVLHISDHSKGSKGLKDPKEYIAIYDNYLNLNRFIFFMIVRGEIPIKNQ